MVEHNPIVSALASPSRALIASSDPGLSGTPIIPTELWAPYRFANQRFKLDACLKLAATPLWRLIPTDLDFSRGPLLSAFGPTRR